MREYFPRLIGNESAKARIGRAIEDGRAPHAFLIGGPSGSGKSVLALEIAAAINCERRTEGEDGGGLLGFFGEEMASGHSLPCGTCNTCRRIYEGNFTDVKLLGKKKDKATLGVDLIKDFREDMFLSATESDYKVYIIDDAESMTSEAQNALLKVLEEPPAGVFIILLAKECDRILTTIKSRTQYIPMSRFSEGEVENFLLERSEEAQRLYRTDRAKFGSAVMSADGRLGLALSLVDPRSAEENAERREDALRIISAVSGRGSFTDIYTALSSLPTKRTELSEAIEEMICATRDLIALSEDRDAPLVFFPSKTEALEYSERSESRRLLLLYDALCEALEYCSKNANVSGLINNLLARLKSGRVDRAYG